MASVSDYIPRSVKDAFRHNSEPRYEQINVESKHDGSSSKRPNRLVYAVGGIALFLIVIIFGLPSVCGLQTV